ncbi:MAG TPA: hypothetical protein VLT88_12090 [Desulfosarcina sp.]|nr:hypothetical protein [Desulfosarcina sp.]
MVRIQNVDASGFEMRVQEWDYLDGTHMVETVGYLVMEQGSYTLEDGTRIQAGLVETVAGGPFQPVAFEEPFNAVPVVVTAITSVNDAACVTGRMADLGVDGFRYGMQEQEANTAAHAPESLAYIAWEPSSGILGDVSYVVGRTGDAVTNTSYRIDVAVPFDAPSAFLADMQTADGRDTASLRYTDKSGTSVEVMIVEEKSKDSEMGHTSEVVGYMLFGR